MNQKRSHSRLPGWVKWLLFILAGLILFVLIIRLSLMTQPVQRWVKNQIVSAANEQLNVRLKVENLTGDLWKEATISGIVLTEEDTVASIDTLSVQYDVLSYFSPIFEVDELRISRPFLKLRQQDTQWNVSTWMKPAEPRDTTGFPIHIENFLLEQGIVDVRIPGFPKDSVLLVNQINLASSFGLYGEDFEASISDFSFRVEETRLTAPLTVQARARASGHSFSLEKFVVATGNSLIQSTGELDTRDSTARMNLQAEPLAWKDIAPYVDETPVRHNLKVDLDIGGNMEQFYIGLNAAADGIRGFGVGADIRWDTTITVTGAWLKAQELNLPEFLGDTTLPHITDLVFEVDGEVPVSDYREANLKGTFSANHISQGAYELERIEGGLRLNEQSLSADLQAHRQDQSLSTSLQVDEVWAQQPVTSVYIEASNINPAYWLGDSAYAGSISLKGSLGGQGFYPDTALWDYSIRVMDSRIMDQKFARAEFEGRFNPRFVSNRSQVRINKSEASLRAEVRNLQTVPRFSYHLSANNFNLAELRLTETYSTAITGTIKGEGRGNAPENLRLSSVIRIDSSAVNGEYIEQFSAQVHVADTVATVEKADLQSTIADGTLGGRMHLIRWYDPQNELDLDIEIKDAGSLAPLAGVEELGGSGTIRGKLTPVSEDSLMFTGEIDFTDVNYNDIFTASQTDGSVEMLMVQNPEYILDLSLSDPVFSSVRLQDLALKTNGKMTEERTTGDFQLIFSSSSEEGQIIHSGTYRIAEDSTSIHTTHYELTSSLRALSLKRPFTIEIAGESVQMDTMRLASDDGAILELAASYADSLNQQGYLRGQNLNLTVVQNLLLGEAYVEGILSGDLQVIRSDTTLTALGDLIISQLEYEGMQFDTLALNLEIANEKLSGGLEAIYENKELIAGKLNVPFELGDPAEFRDEFFERPVQGYLRVNAVSLSRFQNILDQSGITNTQGILRFNSSLQGTAGNPEFTGNLSLSNAVLSGVEVDSVTASLDYQHDDSRLLLNAKVNSLLQNAADIEAEIPFNINLKTFEVNLPGETDNIFVDVETNRFNLAALNDFVDRREVRNIEGRLNGNVQIRGPGNNLQTKGKLMLERGAFRAVQAGIGVNRIHSVVLFEPGVVRLTEFRAESGRGYLDAKGTLELTRLIPGEMDFRIVANNFRAANTAEYNAIIDMDTRVTGTFTKPDVSGELSLINGFIQLENFGEKSVESVQLDDTVAAGIDTVTVYDSLSLGMNVSFGRGFFVRNQRYLEMEIELEGEVDLQKEANQDLQIFGTLNAADGYAKPLGKRFELEEGTLMFSGPPANPELSVRTLYEPPQPDERIQIWYIIEGTVENPQFKYESQPPMELQNIISYTLFGQPFYALDSWKQVVASSGSDNTTVADVALEVLLDRVETLATQRLGIDVVRIENTRVGNESGTAITTGWYLNPKVFFAIQNIITGSTPDTSFLLEYLLKENLKLIISQGNDTRQGVDLRWNFDY